MSTGLTTNPWSLGVWDEDDGVTVYPKPDDDYDSSRNIYPKVCVCDVRDLFRDGCTCGAVERKSWDEKLRDIERKKRESKE